MREVDIEYLELRRDILAQMEEVKEERDVRVRELLASGESVKALVQATGLTRARIYQLGATSTRAR